MAERPKLGELLVRRGAITPEQLVDALETQKHSKMLLGQIITAKQYCSAFQVADALLEQAAWLLDAQETARLQSHVIEFNHWKRLARTNEHRRAFRG